MSKLAAHSPQGMSLQAAGLPGEAVSRVEAAFVRARRHSGRVRLLKIVLPSVALLMVVGFVAKSWVAAPEGVSANLGGTAIEDGRLVMADPRLDGFTADDRAYSVTAARAVQDIGGSGRIDLEEIDARLPFDTESWMTVAARSGIYDRDASTLDITSEMTVKTDTGITALFKSASVDMAAGSLKTQDPVDITLDGARITADSLSVTDRGGVMVFENRVRMHLDGQRLQTASGTGGDDNNED